MIRRASPLLLALVLLLAGCGMMTRQTTLLATGEALRGLGEEFRHVADIYTTSCEAKKIPVASCSDFRTFGLRFQKTYPLAIGLWEAARKANDRAAQRRVAVVLEGLAEDLSRLAIQAFDAVRSAP